MTPIIERGSRGILEINQNRKRNVLTPLHFQIYQSALDSTCFKLHTIKSSGTEKTNFQQSGPRFSIRILTTVDDDYCINEFNDLRRQRLGIGQL